MGLSPRTHNLVSYGVAAVVLLAVFLRRTDLERPVSPGRLGAALWTVHFVRRSLETVLLFRFGQSSVDWVDSLIEFCYYWGFGCWIGCSLDGLAALPALAWPAVVGWTLAEVANFNCHCTLRQLKDKADGAVRSFPQGGRFLFSSCACPHYFFEILSWVLFNVATGFSLPGCLFCLLGAIIMTSYAVERHESYKKRYPNYPAHRTPLFPGVDIRPPVGLVQALARNV